MVTTSRTIRSLAGVVLVATALVGCGSSSPTRAAPTRIQGLQQKPVRQVGTLSLPDVSNGGVDLPLKAEPGGLLLIYFGYTNCPDICPGTLAGLRLALHKLGPQADRVQVAMATVDPTRDTPQVLDEYLGHFFKKNAHALRTEDSTRLKTVANAFGVQYEVQTNAKGAEQVGHSALSFAVDDQGRIIDAWPYGFAVKDIANDMRLLLARSTAS